jgi:hypothetical protein
MAMPSDTYEPATEHGRRRRRVAAAVAMHARPQSEMLSVIRSVGGRISIAELDFELRRRGIVRQPGTILERELRALSNSGLIRGPLNKALHYELTAAGWDAAAKFRERTGSR